MTHPTNPSTPHVDTARSGAAFPAISDEELDRILRQRVEGDARLIATIIQWYLRTPEGRNAILLALGDTDDHIRTIAQDVADKVARHAVATSRVPAHEHHAQNIVISTAVRGLSRIGALLGAVLGGLLAWLLVSNYTVTTISFGTPGEMHSASVNWIKTAIVAVVVLLFAVLGALFGPKRTQQERSVNANIRLESLHTNQGRVPTYGEIATTANRKDDQ